MPSPGIIRQLTEPNGIGVRIDSYVYEGYEIPVYYDPMIGKLIVWATSREYAIERMRRVLARVQDYGAEDEYQLSQADHGYLILCMEPTIHRLSESMARSCNIR